MDGFGFTGAMEKLGVDRRLLTAGDNKGFLDPFSPQNPKQAEHAQVMLNDIHRQFIDVVKTGRGTRLVETPDMFSGLMWTGRPLVSLNVIVVLTLVGAIGYLMALRTFARRDMPAPL